MPCRASRSATTSLVSRSSWTSSTAALTGSLSRLDSASPTVRQQTASAPASSSADSSSIRMKKLSSTRRMRAAFSAAANRSLLTDRAILRGLRHLDLDRAHEPLGTELATDHSVWKAVLDQHPSEAGDLRRLDRRASTFIPDNRERR